jgi:hypothetical protein
MKAIILSPAYGRDYKSKAAAEKDFNDDKDFIIESFLNPWVGKPANKTDLVSAGYDFIEIRYDRLTKLTVWEAK